MQRLLILGLVFGLVAGLALAQNANPCPGDKEYQFNIIGTKEKNPDMDGNNGHRIFVPLNGKTNIFMTGDTDATVDARGFLVTNGDLDCGTTFDVLDADGTDGSAALLVPCDNLTATHLDPDVCFNVYATPLGNNPGGNSTIDVFCEFDASCIGCDLTGVPSCELGVVDFTLAGKNGQPKTENITSLFRASGTIDLDGNGIDAGDISFNNEWIFNIEQLETYYWEYDNHGNRIVQIRFCDVEDDPLYDCGPNRLL